MFYIYHDERFHRHTVAFFINKKGKLKPDEYSFAKFLIELTKRGIIKNE